MMNQCETSGCTEEATHFDISSARWVAVCRKHAQGAVHTSDDVERAATLAWNEAVEAAADIVGTAYGITPSAAVSARATIRALKRTT